MLQEVRKIWWTTNVQDLFTYEFQLPWNDSSEWKTSNYEFPNPTEHNISMDHATSSTV